MATMDKVRVLVVGDSGVGKSSLVHLLCHNEPIGKSQWTIGCSVEVKLHEYKAGTPSEKTYFLELWDVGGSSSHANSRAIFYNPVNGIILVHDLTNRKSQQNLRKWLGEVLNKDGSSLSVSNDYDPEQFAGNQTPILVIGTKADQAHAVRDSILSSSIAEECGADEINMIVFYLTDGNWNIGGDPKSVINQVKALGGTDQIYIFSLGIGSVREQHLRDTSTYNLLYKIPNFSAFASGISVLKELIGIESRQCTPWVTGCPPNDSKLGVSNRDCGNKCVQGSHCVCQLRPAAFSCILDFLSD